MLDAGEAVNRKQKKIDFSGTPDYIIRTRHGIKQTYLSVNISKTTTTKTSFFFFFLMNQGCLQIVLSGLSPPQRRFP